MISIIACKSSNLTFISVHVGSYRVILRCGECTALLLRGIAFELYHSIQISETAGEFSRRGTRDSVILQRHSVNYLDNVVSM
jgi:hypothetical protein